MRNKYSKKGLALGALMVCMFNGNAWARVPERIDKQGDYTFVGGTLLDNRLIDLNTNDSYAIGTTNVIVADEGTIDINIIRRGGWAAIDIYNGIDAPHINDGAITVNINGNLSIAQTSTDSNDVHGVNLFAGNSKLKIDGNLNINQIAMTYDATNPHSGVWCYGILNYGGTVTLNGATAINNISVQSNATGHAEVIAIQSIGTEEIGTKVDINGDLQIGSIDVETNGTKYVAALTACDGGKILINDEKNLDRKISIVGDIDADSPKSLIELHLMNANSSLQGAALSGDGTINLTVANGATWSITDRYLLGDPDYDKNRMNSYVTTLSGDEGIINMNIDASQKDVSQKLFIDTHTGTHYVRLNNIGTGTDGAAGTVLIKVKNEQGVFKANDAEGTLFWNKYDLASRNVAPAIRSNTDDYQTEWYLKGVQQIPGSDVNNPTTSVGIAMVDSSLVYHTWRTENDKLMQRMGELRLQGAEEQGAWFRVKGTKLNHSGKLGFENEYTGYELGYDKLVKQTAGKSFYQGVALSYTDGKAKYFKGSGDNESKSVGFYRTEVGKKGDYLDLVVRVSDSDNKYSVYDTNSNRITGDTNNWGIALSAEAGRKNELNDGWYVEPQAQITIGHLNGDSYKTNNGILVEQDDVFSAVGRLGVNVGKELGKKGIVYVKANLFHEFAGDFNMNMSDTTGNISVNNRYNDTWFEYGLGVSYKTGKNNYIYCDFEKTSGSDFEKEWCWNAGVRWCF